ncbi:hypothetical protein Taro_055141 [Colocasia esculenta]|uniref:Uncharacterized protein n=1 Tax=Colocasia esculenta TaxID=4460 RepID=A0A843XQJ2_COLES|nr:hypothetical protein [Colocasia esculenta]
MQNWSGSVDTSSGSVDTRDSFQNTFWSSWDSVSTLAQVVLTLDQLPRTFWVKLGQCVDSRWGSVNTRGLPRTLFWAVLGQQVDTSTGSVDTSGPSRTKHMVRCNQKTYLMQRFTSNSYNSLTNDI